VSEEWSVPVWALLATLALLAVLFGSLVLVVRRTRARGDEMNARTLAATEALQAQVAELQRRLGPNHARPDQHEYKITMLGEQTPEPEPAPVVPGPLFADLVLRESAVQAASFAAGLRRALAPETRNRIRFEMRREVKRARRQRRADLRQAKREFDARTRAGAESA